MTDVLPVDTGSPAIARLDVPLPELQTQLAERRLQSLLAAPPLGHVEAEQPADWYERVFDALVAAHPEKCRQDGDSQ